MTIGNRITGFAAAILTFVGLAGTLSAATITVPNGSFESPDVGGFYGFADVWQKPAVPVWWPGSAETWVQCSIAFANPASGNPDHISNLDGIQAASLFAVPGFALYQKLDGSNGVTAVYEGFTSQSANALRRSSSGAIGPGLLPKAIGGCDFRVSGFCTSRPG